MCRRFDPFGLGGCYCAPPPGHRVVLLGTGLLEFEWYTKQVPHAAMLEISLRAGLTCAYWLVNVQQVCSPRVQLS